MSKLIAVSIGDIKGIGIEILIKEWKSRRIRNFVLITNYKLFKKYISTKKINIKTYKSSIKNNKLFVSKDSFNIFDIKTSNYNQNTLESLKISYQLVKKKYFIGISISNPTRLISLFVSSNSNRSYFARIPLPLNTPIPI